MILQRTTCSAWESGWKRNETGCDTKDIPTASVVSCRQQNGNRGFLCLNFRSFSKASACIFAGAPVQANQAATAAAPNDDGGAGTAARRSPSSLQGRRHESGQGRLKLPSFLGPIGVYSAALAASPLVPTAAPNHYPLASDGRPCELAQIRARATAC